MAKNQVCGGAETLKEIGPNGQIEDCARECKGVTSMFIFDIETKKCFCEDSATAQGTCKLINFKGYYLYKYANLPGKLLIINWYIVH